MKKEVEDKKAVESAQQRAEVFDALGHPTRIIILKALYEGILGFAELKKENRYREQRASPAPPEQTR